MKLNDDEKRMLQGEEGESIRKSMELLVDIGNAFQAKNMIDISYAHIMCVEADEALSKLFFEFTDGAKVKVPTGTMPLMPNPKYLEDMNVPGEVTKDLAEAAHHIVQQRSKIGAMCTYSCFPYYAYPVRFGEHVAWTETQVVPFINSWYGARTNLQSIISAVASAVTGKTANYGLHLKENRFATGVIEVDKDLHPENFDSADYGAMSYWAGKARVEYEPIIPVYTGLSVKNTTYSKVKNMCSPNVWNSGMPMFHIAGITPEAFTVEEALGGKQPKAVEKFGIRELKETYEELCTADERKVEVVSVGCPHCTMEELKEIVGLLEGKKIKRNTQLWIGTNNAYLKLLEKTNIIETIKNSGALLITEGCHGAMPITILKPRIIATNSPLTANIVKIMTKNNVKVWFGTLENCINCAIKGVWEGN